MACLAFISSGILRQEWGHLVNQELVDRNTAAVRPAESTHGPTAADFSPELYWGKSTMQPG